MYRSKVLDQGWDEQDVRRALEKSPEYRKKNRMSDEDAEEIVRRAYLSVLDREPDPAGMRGYKAKVLNDHRSKQQSTLIDLSEREAGRGRCLAVTSAARRRATGRSLPDRARRDHACGNSVRTEFSQLFHNRAQELEGGVEGSSRRNQNA